MNKELDYLDKIEVFDEAKLPDIEINDEEKERVKKNILEVIEKLKKVNKAIDFKITLDEAIKIKEKLGNNAEKCIFGVKYARLMREIMIRVIEEEENIKSDDIVDEIFLNLRGDYWWRGGAIGYKLYLIKDYLLIYSFDVNYKIRTKYKVKLDEIYGAGVAGKAKCHLSEDEKIIEFKDNRIYLECESDEKKEEVSRFVNSLRLVGVKDIDRSGKPWAHIVYYIIQGIVVLMMINWIWSAFFK